MVDDNVRFLAMTGNENLCLVNHIAQAHLIAKKFVFYKFSSEQAGKVLRNLLQPQACLENTQIGIECHDYDCRNHIIV